MSEVASAGLDSVVARVKGAYGRWRRDTPVAQMRADWDGLFPSQVDASIEDVVANGVPCQWIAAPGADTARVILYFHGGGFQIGSLASHRELMACISAAAGVRVLGVGYRLAPEHRYPAAVQDAVSAFEWLQADGFLAHEIALAGDSAGGGLALSLMLALQARARSLPAAAYLMSAWTDLTAGGASYETRAALDPINQRPMILAMARSYLGGAEYAGDPLASPLMAPAAQLAALPPILMQVGERETVLSDSEQFAQKARAAGSLVQLQVWPGMIHVFQQFPCELPQARDAIAAGGEFLATQLRGATNPESSS